MKEKGYHYSDLKPEKTQLVQSTDFPDKFQLKIIDLGSLTKDSL